MFEILSMYLYLHTCMIIKEKPKMPNIPFWMGQIQNFCKYFIVCKPCIAVKTEVKNSGAD